MFCNYEAIARANAAEVAQRRFRTKLDHPEWGDKPEDYGHPGTLCNNEAVGTSPQGIMVAEARHDVRDWRVERVFTNIHEGTAHGRSPVLSVQEPGSGFWVRVLIPVLSKAKAEDFCTHPEARSETAENEERARLGEVYGPWFDRAVAN